MRVCVCVRARATTATDLMCMHTTTFNTLTKRFNVLIVSRDAEGIQLTLFYSRAHTHIHTWLGPLYIRNFRLTFSDHIYAHGSY